MTQPDVKRCIVLEAGLSESQCSQIYRVATSPQEIFDKYVSGTLAFNAALQEVRQQSKPLTAAQKAAKLRAGILSVAHRFKTPFAAIEDTDFLVVIPGAIQDKKEFREGSFSVNGFKITVEKE